MSLVRVQGPQRSGLLALVEGLRAWFALPFVAAKCAEERVRIPVIGRTGWRQREQQLNTSPEGGNRVLLLPGNASGALGTLAMPERPGVGYGGNPRLLWTNLRVVTASVWSYDPDNPDDEEAQIEASDQLVELTLQGLDKSFRATLDDAGETVVEVAGTGAILPGATLRRDTKVSVNAVMGLEVLIEFVHVEPLYDMPNDLITEVLPVIEKVLRVPSP